MVPVARRLALSALGGLLDVEGYFEHLVAFLDRGVADGLLRPESRCRQLRVQSCCCTPRPPQATNR